MGQYGHDSVYNFCPPAKDCRYLHAGAPPRFSCAGFLEFYAEHPFLFVGCYSSKKQILYIKSKTPFSLALDLS